MPQCLALGGKQVQSSYDIFNFNHVSTCSQELFREECKTVYILNSISVNKVICEYIGMYLHVNVCVCMCVYMNESGRMVAHMKSNPSTWGKEGG